MIASWTAETHTLHTFFREKGREGGGGESGPERQTPLFSMPFSVCVRSRPQSEGEKLARGGIRQEMKLK